MPFTSQAGAWMAQLPPMDLYGAQLFHVTGQQLSVAATRRTLARIQALFDGHLPSPAELLGADPGQLREEEGDVSGRSAYAFTWRSLIDA
jgi:3-methyladenine DNA glycosylase/8-oxoguanine DNA glycosylase